ncbi:MAG TPA: cytochrome C oxidase subunit IV family protein [Herpetosiphonaceae bacterium]
MAHDAHHDDTHDGAEVVHHSHAKQYIAIFFFLLVVTGVEIAIPLVSPGMGIPKVPEVLLLLTLMAVKGTFVVMYYMHLKGDRRMFGALFIFPLIIVTGMMFAFFALFQPKFW